MTARQKQLILCCFDLLSLDAVDGIWGKQSEAATRKLQHGMGITEDGVFGNGTRDAAFDRLTSGEPLKETEKNVERPLTGTFWDEIEFFDREEFRCKCGGKYCNGFPMEPDETMVRTVDEIRRRLGVPVRVSSGGRCTQHNANVGGVANSNHVKFRASDLISSKSPQEMARVAEEVMGNTGEIGIYSWGIHVGVNCKYSRFYG